MFPGTAGDTGESVRAWHRDVLSYPEPAIGRTSVESTSVQHKEPVRNCPFDYAQQLEFDPSSGTC